MKRATLTLTALTLALALTACSKGGKPEADKTAAKPAAPLLLPAPRSPWLLMLCLC